MRTLGAILFAAGAGLACDPEPEVGAAGLGEFSESSHITRRLPLEVDPFFDVATLSPTERAWYDRLAMCLDASGATANERAGSDDVYRLGRYLGDYTAALVMALRATGDRTFLDSAVALWSVAEEDLVDAWDDGTIDGFRSWRMRTVESPDYRGRDTHAMDEAMTHGNLALVAYAAHVNREVDPSYAAAADRWCEYLQSEFLAKWHSRAGDAERAWHDEAGFYKRFTHPRANQLRLAAYLGAMTGDSLYTRHAARCVADLRRGISVTDGAAVWSHQVEGWDEGTQKVGYAQYTLRVWLDLAHDDVLPGVPTAAELDAFTRTVRDRVFRRGPNDTMAERVDGSGDTPVAVYGLAGFGRWDESGTILAVAEAHPGRGSAGVSVAAYALSAVSRREGDGT